MKSVPKIVFAAWLVTAMLSGAAMAQNASPSPTGDASQLSPEDEAKQEVLKMNWGQMSPADRLAARDKIRAELQKRYDSASPDEQAKIREDMKQNEANDSIQSRPSEDNAAQEKGPVDNTVQVNEGQNPPVHLPSGDQ